MRVAPETSPPDLPRRTYHSLALLTSARNSGLSFECPYKRQQLRDDREIILINAISVARALRASPQTRHLFLG